MKYFSRQLLLKHRFLQQVDSESPRQAERELNSHIDLGLFLSVADLEPRSIQVCVWGEEEEGTYGVCICVADCAQLVLHSVLSVSHCIPCRVALIPSLLSSSPSPPLPQLLLEEELALDVLFSMAPAQLQQLIAHLGLPVEEEGRLATSLKLLSSCYRKSVMSR